jgi:hypothetical protein
MTTTKSSAELLHRLLFRALIEMREQGRESKNKAVVHLTDLFHTTVLELGQAAEGKLSYDDVLHRLEEKATEKGLERWLLAAVAEIESAQPPTPVN